MPFKHETIKKIEMSDIEKISEDTNEDESDGEGHQESPDGKKGLPIKFIEETSPAKSRSSEKPPRKQSEDQPEFFEKESEKVIEPLSDESNSTEVKLPNSTNFVLDLDMTNIKSNSFDRDKETSKIKEEGPVQQNFKKQKNLVPEIVEEMQNKETFGKKLVDVVGSNKIESFSFKKIKTQKGLFEEMMKENANKMENPSEIIWKKPNQITRAESGKAMIFGGVHQTSLLDVNDNAPLMRSKSTRTENEHDQEDPKESINSPSLKNISTLKTKDQGIIPREFVSNTSNLNTLYSGKIFNWKKQET